MCFFIFGNIILSLSVKKFIFAVLLALYEKGDDRKRVANHCQKR